MNNTLIAAIRNYNETTPNPLTLLDALIINHIASNEYTTDYDLAQNTLCSERTIKRAITKLCDLNFLIKHYDKNNTKHVTINQTSYHNLLGDLNV